MGVSKVLLILYHSLKIAIIIVKEIHFVRYQFDVYWDLEYLGRLLFQSIQIEEFLSLILSIVKVVVRVGNLEFCRLIFSKVFCYLEVNVHYL